MRSEPYTAPIYLPPHVYQGLRAAELAGVPLAYLVGLPLDGGN